MNASKIIVLEPNRAARCTYREPSASRQEPQLARVLCLTELIVTALIGAGFCFCIGLVISML